MKDPQTELFEQPRHSADKDVCWLEDLLLAREEWMDSHMALLAIGRGPTESNRRWIRDLASQSAWVISGQKGYKHIKHATAEEIGHAAAWLESQAKKMAERAGGIRANAHKIFGR